MILLNNKAVLRDYSWPQFTFIAITACGHENNSQLYFLPFADSLLHPNWLCFFIFSISLILSLIIRIILSPSPFCRQVKYPGIFNCPHLSFRKTDCTHLYLFVQLIHQSCNESLCIQKRCFNFIIFTISSYSDELEEHSIFVRDISFWQTLVSLPINLLCLNTSFLLFNLIHLPSPDPFLSSSWLFSE